MSVPTKEKTISAYLVPRGQEADRNISRSRRKYFFIFICMYNVSSFQSVIRCHSSTVKMKNWGPALLILYQGITRQAEIHVLG